MFGNHDFGVIICVQIRFRSSVLVYHQRAIGIGPNLTRQPRRVAALLLIGCFFGRSINAAAPTSLFRSKLTQSAWHSGFHVPRLASWYILLQPRHKPVYWFGRSVVKPRKHPLHRFLVNGA